jgi:branched-subunit amino acid transport protein
MHYLQTIQTEIAIFGMFFVTLISRVGFLFFKKPLKLSVNWQYVLRLAPAVALATTVMLDTFFAQGNFIGFMHNMRLLAVIAATVSFIYSRKIWVSLLVGLVVWCSYTIYA